jgi:hypothetical protein
MEAPLLVLYLYYCGSSVTVLNRLPVHENPVTFIPELADFYSAAESVVTLNRKASRVVFSPDGRLVLLADKNGDVYQYPTPLATKQIHNNLGTDTSIS